MPRLSSWLSAAVCHHRSGDAVSAEKLCRKILKTNPDSAETLHLLAILAAEDGRLQEAALLLVESNFFDPSAERSIALGMVLEQQCRLEAALAAYVQARDLDPLEASSWETLARALDRMGKFEESSSVWARRLRMESGTSPRHQELQFCLGNALALSGQKEQARAQYQAIVDCNPKFSQGWFHLGVIQSQLNDLACSAQAYETLLALDSTHARGWNNLGILKQACGEIPAAINCYQNALSAEPDYTQAIYNLGSALQLSGNLAQAAEQYEHVLACEPSNLPALNNYGNTMVSLNRLREAAGIFEQVLELVPEDPMARYNRGLVRLLLGDLRRGFADYDARLELSGTRLRDFAQTAWTWQPLTGKKILLVAEQGLGDTIQFIRYADLLVAKGAGEVLVECPASLVKLIATVPGVGQVIATGQPLPPFDFHVPLLSLPQRLATTGSTIPGNVPYLRFDDVLPNVFLRPVPHIGVVWAGNPLHPNDHNRSMPIEALGCLETFDSIEFVSLQRDLEAPSWVTDVRPQMVDFAYTAAIIMQLDLVVTVDTSIAHLAGALGKQVWLLLPFAPDWRWMMNREDSPWYPTARLFRQTEPGDWDGVMQRVCGALRQWQQIS